MKNDFGLTYMGCSRSKDQNLLKKNALTKFKTNIYDVAQFKATKTGNYTNVMDQLTTEKNKIFDYCL